MKNRGCAFRSTTIVIHLMVAIPLAVWLSQAHAQNVRDIVAGRQLASTHCSKCHLVTSQSDHGTVVGAPTFTAIANNSSTSVQSLRDFFERPHYGMQDLHLSRVEIDDLAAYILSLRHK
jgi:mono/diheme cytochrome c family protein